MKKGIICACLLLVTGILCSCGGAKDILLRTSGYSGGCHVTLSGNSYDLELESGEGGNFTVVFCAPPSFSDMKATYTGEEFTLYYKDMVWTGNSEQFPNASVVTVLREAFIETGRLSSLPTKSAGGFYIVQGRITSGDFRFSFHADGTPHKLTVEEIGLEAEFTENLHAPD